MCCFWVCIRNTVYALRGMCSWFWASLQIVDLLLDEDLDAKSRGAPLRALTDCPAFGRADERLTQFIQQTAGHRSSCPFHTWLRNGKAAALDHVITWNLILDGNGFTKRAPGSYDHRQVMARVDSSLLQPSPRPPKPLYQGRLDPVAFSRNLGLWKRLCSEAGLEGGDGAEGELIPPGPELYRRYCAKTQLMLKVSLTLQRKNEKRLRRARERPSDRCKQQRHWRNRLRLLQAALRDAIIASLNDPVTEATALAIGLLNLGSPPEFVVLM